MNRNVEVKARVENPAALLDCVEGIADGPGIVLNQEDTFFECINGRFKLRRFPDDSAEIIYYQRKNNREPEESQYFVVPIKDSAPMIEILKAAFGIRGIVQKERKLFFVGKTRIHIDQVEGLGSYMELEVVLTSDQSLEDGIKEAQRIMKLLDIEDNQLQERAYIDLLEEA